MPVMGVCGFFLGLSNLVSFLFFLIVATAIVTCVVTADVMIEFMRRLVWQSARKTLLIVDGHPVHRSKKVKQWRARHGDDIQPYLLPGYSPELNPDELLNQDVKSNALGRKRPHDQDEMIDDVRSYLRITQRRPNTVKHYF